MNWSFFNQVLQDAKVIKVTESGSQDCISLQTQRVTHLGGDLCYRPLFALRGHYVISLL